MTESMSPSADLSYANVSIAGSTESTVTNADGEFTFKVKEPVEDVAIEVSHLGYNNRRILLKEGDAELPTVWLTPSTLMLEEVHVDAGRSGGQRTQSPRIGRRSH